MPKPVYSIDTFEGGLYHFFDSVSENKTTKKVVAYFPTEGDFNLYQLVFGDLLPNGEIDILSSSQHKDMSLIIVTVIETIPIFFQHHPNTTVYFTGSTPSRTRLYRAIISKFVKKYELFYSILGITEINELELFRENHVYIGYLIKQKL